MTAMKPRTTVSNTPIAIDKICTLTFYGTNAGRATYTCIVPSIPTRLGWVIGTPRKRVPVVTTSIRKLKVPGSANGTRSA